MRCQAAVESMSQASGQRTALDASTREALHIDSIEWHGMELDEGN